METCGLICVSTDYKKFLMRCCFCPTDVEVAQWQNFVLHFRNAHSVQTLSQSIKEELTASEEYFILEKEDEEQPKTKDQEESQKDLNVGVEIEAVRSSPSEVEQLEALDQDLDPEHYHEEDVDELPEKDANVQLAPIYKFHPSFYRKDPRTVKFIEIYKAHPSLWNPSHSKFKEPSACKEALKQMLAELESKAAVFLNEKTLKVAISKIHQQYNIVEKRVHCGNQKSHSLAFSNYNFCSFLKASQEHDEANSNEKIQLDFSKKNKLTTDLIELYANYPQLYEPTHSEFSNMNSRKQAYDSLAAEISVPNADISSDDIYRAIQNIRQWYYKSTKHSINAGKGAEKIYLEMCQFMPPKMFKQRLICEICQQVTSSDHVLQSHIFKAHSIGDLPFKCTLCDRSFDGRGELGNHIQRVHIGKTLKCSHCERTFAVISDLELHIRIHTGHKPYVCEHCGKSFRLRSQMKLHVTAIHTKIRAFKCDMCPKDFIKKVDLTDHIKGHLNIRDKICSECGKGFTSCHSLIRHRQIHSKVKKFVCKLCEARFSQFVGLNSHMKRTHNIVRNNGQKATESVPAEH
ncbi:hypothetical protein KR009_010521 [Drosophila setifemur]|nr:hypothetical protein KR009_010521 [Drosophila setifemur]